MTKLVYGVGLNDAYCKTQNTVNGKVVYCRFYQSWKRMLARCYGKYCKLNHPSYDGCSVCDEWLTFSNFKAWMERQANSEMFLDKDILMAGNKIYSPENCVFVDVKTNSFITDSKRSRGDWPIGVYLKKDRQKFASECSNPFTLKKEFLGYFDCPNKAHLAWRKRKHELACQLAGLQTDTRVAEALRNRYKTTVQRQLTE